MKVSGCFPCVPRRYVISLICFFGMMMSTNLRYCISIAITEMVLPPHVNQTLSTPGHVETCPYDDASEQLEGNEEGEFSWDEPTQGLVLGSFFWGYGLTQIPAGHLAERLGGKYTLAFAVLMPSLCTLATPLAARWGGALGLILLRVVMGSAQGFLFPSVNTILAKWVATEERGRLGSLVFSGAMFGSVVSMILSGLLLTLADWPVMFYVYGAMGLLWVCLWLCCGYSRPEDHPGLSDSEKTYLENYAATVNMKQKLPPTPWRHILKSVPLWGLIIATMGFDWGFYTIVTDMPKYMRTVLHFSIEETGIRSAALYISSGVVAVLAGGLVDFLLVKRITPITTSRRIFSTLSSVGPAVGLVAASYAECNKDLVTLFLVLGMGMMGLYYPSVSVNGLDLSPNYSGTVIALANGVGSIVGVFTPYLAGLLIPDNTLDQWRLVFLTAAAALVISAIVYDFMCSGKVQYWNDIQLADPDKKHEMKTRNGKDEVATIEGVVSTPNAEFRKTNTEGV